MKGRRRFNGSLLHVTYWLETNSFVVPCSLVVKLCLCLLPLAFLDAGCQAKSEQPRPHHQAVSRRAILPSEPSEPDGDAASAAPPTAMPSDSLGFVGSETSLGTLVSQLRRTANEPRDFRPLGGSSITFRVELEPSALAAFKPATRDRPTAYQREIAAFRLAEALGLPNIPPAIIARYARESIQTHLHSDYRNVWNELNDRILWDAHGYTVGALIHWVSDVKPVRLSELGTPSWTQWLLQGIAAPSMSVARDLSNMLVFDYLIGNWDRFSGGNFKMTQDSLRLIYLDHNSAFGAPLRDKVHRRIYQKLKQAQKFSKSLVERLATLDENQLDAMFEVRDASLRLLSELQVKGLMERRATILSYVQSLIEIHGDEKVLIFD